MADDEEATALGEVARLQQVVEELRQFLVVVTAASVQARLGRRDELGAALPM